MKDISYKSKKKLDYFLRSIIFLFYFVISVLAALAPIIQHFDGYPSGEGIYLLFSNICHQYPTRSIWIFDRPFALCARCTAGYLGIATGAFLGVPNVKYLTRFIVGILLVGLVAIDPLIQLYTKYESNNYLRILTGLIGGYGAFIAFYPITFNKRSFYE